MSWQAESGPLSVDDDGLLTLARPDAEGEPDEFARLGFIEYARRCDLDDLGAGDDFDRLLAEWRRASAEGRAERLGEWRDYRASR